MNTKTSNEPPHRRKEVDMSAQGVKFEDTKRSGEARYVVRELVADLGQWQDVRAFVSLSSAEKFINTLLPYDGRLAIVKRREIGLVRVR